MQDASPHVLRVRLFGQFRICCGDKVLEDVISGKAKELFCYLLMHQQRPLARESLASILWGDCTTAHSKQYLRKALWQLQRTLCRSAASTEPILQVNSQWISVSPRANIWVDVVEFEHSCSGTPGLSWCADDPCMEILGTAVNLYQGDLLEGWYQEWCLYDRERLQNLYLVMLDKLVGYSEMHRKYENGIDYATRILQCDRAHEISHQRLMRLRYTLGDRAGALRQYENCAAALKEELGVAPSERTQQLCRQIREDHTAAIMPGTTGGRAEPEDDSSLFEGVIHRLEEVRTTLAALKNTVDESLLRLSQALRSSDRHPGQSNRDRS